MLLRSVIFMGVAAILLVKLLVQIIETQKGNCSKITAFQKQTTAAFYKKNDKINSITRGKEQFSISLKYTEIQLTMV